MTFCIINPIQHSSFIFKVLPDILVRRSSEFYLTDAIFTGYVRWTDGPSETLVTGNKHIYFFGLIPMDSRTKDLVHFADIFHCDVTVPIYFYSGERICQILHARLRLGCSSLNADLYRNYLREDNKCTCGLPETVTHFFYECNNYAFLRNRTIAIIPVPTNTDILLSGCPLYDNDVNGEIFAQVHKFIIDSNRFS